MESKTKSKGGKAKASPSAFAVIETGGKQYKVGSGEVIKIEKLAGEPKVGDTVTFDKVVFHQDGEDVKIGSPYLSGIKVTGIIKDSGKAKKVTVLKYKAKSRYRKLRGHRQPYVRVEIATIK